jgi:hypothetical protein
MRQGNFSRRGAARLAQADLRWNLLVLEHNPRHASALVPSPQQRKEDRMTDETTVPTVPMVEDDLTCGGFFEEMDNDKPYLKVGVEGFAGTGKTYLLAQLAIGLHRKIGSTKPIVFVDTEKAAKFLRHMFDEAGIKLLRKQSRSLKDLQQTMVLMREQQVSNILMVDSLTHIWENFLESYKQRTKHTRLEFQDWGIIKPTWKTEFSEHLVNDPYHFLFAGRAGYEYEQQEDDRGKKQIVKSGVKMKVEGETAYEPDILVLMERFEEVLDDKKSVWREATVIKDRSTMVDGKTFRNPTYEHFAPAVDRCLDAGVKRAQPLEQNAGSLFHTEEDKAAWKRRIDVELEEIEGMLTATWPGQTAEAKRMKVESLFHAFGTRSWTAITQMRPERLEQGKASIAALIAKLRAEAEQSTT